MPTHEMCADLPQHLLRLDHDLVIIHSGWNIHNGKKLEGLSDLEDINYFPHSHWQIFVQNILNSEHYFRNGLTLFNVLEEVIQESGCM